ncbi:porin family protein [Herbaspirillum frisingense]|uniref:porin family protein n=1 Tax=Herbaspirillum frisingense TaxID=92645 RepID=UPI001F3C3756|nr:porin family protein [Herbaspirillum frisingense]
MDVEHSPGTIEKNDAGMIRFGGGYQFTPNFSVEMGYFRIGATSLEKTDRFSRDSAKARVSGFDLTAAYKFSNVLPGVYFKGGSPRPSSPKMLAMSIVVLDFPAASASGHPSRGPATCWVWAMNTI